MKIELAESDRDLVAPTPLLRCAAVSAPAVVPSASRRYLPVGALSAAPVAGRRGERPKKGPAPTKEKFDG